MAEMTVVVIDGQGGGIGAHIIEKMQKNLPEPYIEKMDIIALGTNAIATSLMMKAGANKAATGENSIVQVCKSANIIIGSWAIVIPSCIFGRFPHILAAAVASSRARKLL